MKKRFSRFIVLVISILLIGSSVMARTVNTTKGSALLYEISGKGLKKPSYLFGTIHLICEKNMFPADKLLSYVSRTEQVMLEIDLTDQAALQRAAKFAVMSDGKTMKDFLKSEEYTKVDDLFKNYMGVSFDSFQAIKPVFSSVALAASPKALGCKPPIAYDVFLSQTATEKKLPIIGLETVDVQFAALDSVPIETQTKSLKEMAADPDQAFNEFKELTRIYLTQNSDELYNFTLNGMRTSGFPPASIVKLLDERNTSWIPVIERNINSKPAFIGIGGGHLGGKKGVVNLLRKRGYKLIPIKL